MLRPELHCDGAVMIIALSSCRHSDNKYPTPVAPAAGQHPSRWTLRTSPEVSVL